MPVREKGPTDGPILPQDPANGARHDRRYPDLFQGEEIGAVIHLMGKACMAWAVPGNERDAAAGGFTQQHRRLTLPGFDLGSGEPGLIIES